MGKILSGYFVIGIFGTGSRHVLIGRGRRGRGVIHYDTSSIVPKALPELDVGDRSGIVLEVYGIGRHFLFNVVFLFIF